MPRRERHVTMRQLCDRMTDTDSAATRQKATEATCIIFAKNHVFKLCGI